MRVRRFGADVTAVVGDDAAGDGKAEAGAILARGKVGRENAFPVFWLNAVSVVGDLAALRARSRIRESEALLDPDGMGAFRVLEWIVSPE